MQFFVARIFTSKITKLKRCKISPRARNKFIAMNKIRRRGNVFLNGRVSPKKKKFAFQKIGIWNRNRIAPAYALNFIPIFIF